MTEETSIVTNRENSINILSKDILILILSKLDHIHLSKLYLHVHFFHSLLSSEEVIHTISRLTNIRLERYNLGCFVVNADISSPLGPKIMTYGNQRLVNIAIEENKPEILFNLHRDLCFYQGGHFPLAELVDEIQIFKCLLDKRTNIIYVLLQLLGWRKLSQDMVNAFIHGIVTKGKEEEILPYLIAGGHINKAIEIHTIVPHRLRCSEKLIAKAVIFLAAFNTSSCTNIISDEIKNKIVDRGDIAIYIMSVFHKYRSPVFLTVMSNLCFYLYDMPDMGAKIESVQEEDINMPCCMTNINTIKYKTKDDRSTKHIEEILDVRKRSANISRILPSIIYLDSLGYTSKDIVDYVIIVGDQESLYWMKTHPVYSSIISNHKFLEFTPGIEKILHGE